MTETLSKYKLKKLSFEAFKNGLRLHFDSILLFQNRSFASAFQLSVLALEEIAKSDWIEDYYWNSNIHGQPDKEFEQKWLKRLYFHPAKQKYFIRHGEMMKYSPKFVRIILDNNLELKKQRATYVGLDKSKKRVNIKSRISTPNRIKEIDAQQQISVLNDFLDEMISLLKAQDYLFDIPEKNQLLNNELKTVINNWEYKSGIRSKRWIKEWMKTKTK